MSPALSMKKPTGTVSTPRSRRPPTRSPGPIAPATAIRAASQVITARNSAGRPAASASIQLVTVPTR